MTAVAALPAAGIIGKAQPAPRLPARERRTLRAAMDAIIPAGGNMPAASAIGGVAYVERMCAQDAAFQQVLLAGLRTLEPLAGATTEQQQPLLANCEKTNPQFFAALRDAVYEAYYTNPKIWKLLGYRFRTGANKTARLEPFDEQRLKRVRGMGRLYRPVEA